MIFNIELTDDERQPCEVWTRVMGYHRPVSEFNIGKKQEYVDRKEMTEKRSRLNKPDLIMDVKNPMKNVVTNQVNRSIKELQSFFK